MNAAEAGGRLVAEIVAAAGFDRGEVEVRRVLGVFAEFASIPVDDVNAEEDAEEDADRLLFETAAALTGEFEVSLGRQCSSRWTVRTRACWTSRSWLGFREQPSSPTSRTLRSGGAADPHGRTDFVRRRSSSPKSS